MMVLSIGDIITDVMIVLISAEARYLFGADNETCHYHHHYLRRLDRNLPLYMNMHH